VALFTVDSSLARIYVGPSGGDTVGTLLVLGNKTNAGDPTGVAGSMYYNSNRGSMRCYQSSGWEDCVRRARNNLYVYSDFTSKGGDNYFTDASSGTSATVSGNDAPPIAGHPGIISLRQSYCCWAADMGSRLFYFGNGDAYTEVMCSGPCPQAQTSVAVVSGSPGG
jgi:hypothetical protein